MIYALNSDGYMRLLFLYCLTITMTCASIAFAQAPSLNTLQTATISGTVLDPTTAPIPNAKVRLSSSGSPTVETKTDIWGHFEIIDRPGDYTLEVAYPGFRIYKSSILLSTGRQNVKNIVLDLRGKSNVTPEPPKPPIKTLVVPFAKASPLASKSPKSSAITGTVTDSTGTSIVEAVITLKSIDGLTLQTKTDRDGHFAIIAPLGDYT